MGGEEREVSQTYTIYSHSKNPKLLYCIMFALLYINYKFVRNNNHFTWKRHSISSFICADCETNLLAVIGDQLSKDLQKRKLLCENFR